MVNEDLEHRLEQSGRFDDASRIHVAAVRVNDFGEGEYEVRFAYPPGYDATGDEDFLLRLKRRLEDVLPRAWVAAFAISSRMEDGNEVTVTFDYLPRGAVIPA